MILIEDYFKIVTFLSDFIMFVVFLKITMTGKKVVLILLSMTYLPPLIHIFSLFVAQMLDFQNILVIHTTWPFLLLDYSSRKSSC